MFSMDGFNGYSPLFALANEIGISMGSKKFLDEFFKMVVLLLQYLNMKMVVILMKN